MGMDVFGKNARSPRGDYFRNNVWWWRPLWDFVVTVDDGREIDEELAEAGHCNDGAGLDDEASQRLAKALFEALESGAVKESVEEFNKMLSEIALEDCQYCDSTGIRTDEVGVRLGMPEKEIDPALAVIAGRTHGTCTACNGMGRRVSIYTSYSFDEENVREFAEFLADCGGFSIW